MYRKLKRRYTILLVSLDLAFIPLSLFCAGIIRSNVNLFHDSRYLIVLAPLMLLYITILYILDCYNIEKSFFSIPFFAQFFISFILISILVALTLYLVPVIWYGRGLWAIQIILSFIFMYFWRLLFDTFIHVDIEKKKLLILGHGEVANDVTEILKTNKYYCLVGSIDDNQQIVSNIIGNTKDLPAILDEQTIDILIISNDIELDDCLKGVLVEAKMRGLIVYDIATFYETMMEKIPVYYITDFWILLRTFAGITEKIYSSRVKRVTDFFLSLLGLLVASPFMLITAIFIKITSHGPIFYKQVRVGYDDENFEIIKFRSMTVNAEKDGIVWAQENDPRVTLIGKFIRKTRIDELPQLWNILKGDMTLIGPRPERPEFVEQLKKDIPYYSLRHAIKPGLTGWAQVNYRYGASTEDAMEKLQYDLYYMRHLSFRLDLRIFFKTIRVMLLGIGAR